MTRIVACNYLEIKGIKMISLGGHLKKERKNISLEEVSKATKITKMGQMTRKNWS